MELYAATFWDSLSVLGPIGCPETSANNYQHTLRNIPEGQRPQLHPGWSLKSRMTTHCKLTVANMATMRIVTMSDKLDLDIPCTIKCIYKR